MDDQEKKIEAAITNKLSTIIKAMTDGKHKVLIVEKDSEKVKERIDIDYSLN